MPGSAVRVPLQNSTPGSNRPTKADGRTLSSVLQNLIAVGPRPIWDFPRGCVGGPRRPAVPGSAVRVSLARSVQVWTLRLGRIGSIRFGPHVHGSPTNSLVTGRRTLRTGSARDLFRVRDLHGRTVIPGINDAHHHFSVGPPQVDVDLGTPEPTWEQVRATAAIAKKSPPDAVTIGFGVFGDPSRDARPQRRTIRWRCRPSGHAMVLNTAGLGFYHVSEDARGVAVLMVPTRF